MTMMMILMMILTIRMIATLLLLLAFVVMALWSGALGPGPFVLADYGSGNCSKPPGRPPATPPLGRSGKGRGKVFAFPIDTSRNTKPNAQRMNPPTRRRVGGLFEETFKVSTPSILRIWLEFSFLKPVLLIPWFAPPIERPDLGLYLP